MNEGISVLFALFFISAMMAASMLIAWHSLGRPRHALVLAVAFALAAVQWSLNLGSILIWPGNEALFGLVNLCGTAVALLLLAGFRERAGLRSRWPVALLITAAAALVIIIAVARHRLGWAMAMPQAARALLLPVAAATVLPRGRRPHAAEIGMVVLLVLVAALSAAAGLLALGRVELGNGVPADQLLLLLGLPAAFAGIGLFAVLLLTTDLAERLRLLATSDPLTGVLNRRGFRDAATRALANAARQRRTITVVVADVDRFKSINDSFGHAAGDAVLIRVAAYLESAVRTGDLVGRVGGEEFAILLDGTSGSRAFDAVERIRGGLESLEFGLPHPIRLTASFGMMCPPVSDITLDEALNEADEALYAAKLGGRNRVVFARADENRHSAGTDQRAEIAS